MGIADIPLEKTGLLVVFDYETSGLHADDGAAPATLGLKWGASRREQALVPIDQGMLDKPGTQPTLFGDAPNVTQEEWIRIHDWMQQQHLIAHHAKADLWFAWAGLRRAPFVRTDLGKAYYWDTMVVEALLSPGMRVSLDTIAERNGWNEPYRESDKRMRDWALKHKHRGQVRYDLAPWDILAPYLAGDLERTWRLFWDQDERIEQGLIGRDLLRRELDMVRTLFRMEQRGLPYQVHESLDAATKAAVEMDKLERTVSFNMSSNAAAGAWFIDHGARLGKTDKGLWSLDQAAITRLIELGIPGAKAYQRWQKLQTARSLWYLGWAEKAGADGRVRADYRQVKTFEGTGSNGTVSGRLAVSRVQVQAIPSGRQIPEGYPKMQSLIRPEPPKRLFEVDLSQAEMRVVASQAGCIAMLEGFCNGMDAHDSTTQLIWGIDKDHEDWDARRQVAKRLGFGVVYGAGIKTLAAQILLFTGQDLGEDGVRTLWDQYRAAFPELFRYSRYCQRQVERCGWIRLPGNKIRQFSSFESHHKALNAVIQGGVAAAMSEAMNEIEEVLPGIMVGQVHDSVLLEVEDPADVTCAQRIITRVFESWYPGCPFPTNATDYATK